jgi:hypothetical protein
VCGADIAYQVSIGMAFELFTDWLMGCRTAIWVAEQLTDAKFELEEQARGQFIIHCEGIGFTAPPSETASMCTSLEETCMK